MKGIQSGKFQEETQGQEEYLELVLKIMPGASIEFEDDQVYLDNSDLIYAALSNLLSRIQAQRNAEVMFHALQAQDDRQG